MPKLLRFRTVVQVRVTLVVSPRLKDKPGRFVDCSEHFACHEPKPHVYFKYHSWTESEGLYCSNKLIRETGKSLCLLVNSCTCFFFLNLSDILGRRTVIIINSVFVITALSLAYISSDFYAKMFLIGFAFGCEGGFSSLFQFMMNEVSRMFRLTQTLRPSSSQRSPLTVSPVSVLGSYF